MFRDIPYLDLVTDDPQGTVDLLCDGFAFAPAASAADTDRRALALRNGPVTIVVSSPVGIGGPFAGHLERHGTGIIDIPMTSTDLDADIQQLVRAGTPMLPAPAGVAVAAGFGPVVHTLLPDGAAPLPPGLEWTLLPERPVSRGALDIRALDHIAVCLPGGTLQQTADHYASAFGLPRYSSEYIEVGAQAMDSVVVRSPSGAITFTLIEPDLSHEAGQIDEFLDRHSGAGVQHLAFLVDDIVTAVRQGRDAGIAFLTPPGVYYETLLDRVTSLRDRIGDLRDTGVLADCDEWGYLLQIFTRSPYPRRTLFHELIQRNDARGFGSANIRALYEAVERERQRESARSR
ncbi:4-hydroxyphenylpyruvate dioxygenase [Micromonospora tarapacensis]|uniref:4-hydroxyphenylpyruvate dioxygenase n=1 Tax=Micromonospora tarapacensis TaxID=2835305 RepID=UPI002F420314